MVILQKNNLNIFLLNIEKPRTLVNFISFPRLHNFSGRAVISKCSEFLDYHLKPLTQRGWSYIKDSGGFIKKARNLGSIPENALLVTADVIVLYSSIPQDAGLKLDKRT